MISVLIVELSEQWLIVFVMLTDYYWKRVEVSDNMNEVSGGKPELASTSSWETLPSQQLPSISTIHHHHQTVAQETNPPVTQVIVPTPVKLQAPILSPPPNVEHCTVLTHMQQPALMTQVQFPYCLFIVFCLCFFFNYSANYFNYLFLGWCTR